MITFNKHDLYEKTEISVFNKAEVYISSVIFFFFSHSGQASTYNPSVYNKRQSCECLLYLLSTNISSVSAREKMNGTFFSLIQKICFLNLTLAFDVLDDSGPSGFSAWMSVLSFISPLCLFNMNLIVLAQSLSSLQPRYIIIFPTIFCCWYQPDPSFFILSPLSTCHFIMVHQGFPTRMVYLYNDI